MKLGSSELEQLAKLAVEAASRAGAFVSDNMGEPLEVNIKTDEKLAVNAGLVGGSFASHVVTEVDLRSQELILELLLPSCKQYNLALLTEESVDDKERLESAYFWCIDPLDGTLPFIESVSGFSVSIALVDRNGKPHIGVVYDPMSNTLYHAVKGKGVFKNGSYWELPASNKSVLTLIFDRSFLKLAVYPEVKQEMEQMASQMGYEGVDIIHHGGAVMNACWVLESGSACYFKFPKKQVGGGSLWDYAATALFFSELQAVVSDMYGQPLDLNRPDSTFMNHRGVLFASSRVLSQKVIEMYSALRVDR